MYNLRTYVGFDVGDNGSITFRLSIIEDTSVTTDTFVYEPFTNGASPNPDYPQEIEVIKDNVGVKITGKNLLPFTNQDFTTLGVRFYVDNGSLYLDGTSTQEINTTISEFKDNFSFYLSAGTYYFDRGDYKGAVYIKKHDEDG